MTYTAHQIGRYARKVLRGHSRCSGPIFARVGIAYDRSRYIVKFYYLVSAFISYELLPRMHGVLEQSPAWDYRWPVSWLGRVGLEQAPEWIVVALFLASLLAFQFPDRAIARLGFAILCLFVVALSNSTQGGTDHSYHEWLWIGVCFVFLPNAQRSATRDSKMAYLSVIVATQALMLFFYTLAGFWKVRSGLSALHHGVEGNFAPRGLALQLADRVLATGTKPLLADWAISNYWLLWPMFLLIMYVQLTAIFVLLRPRLHMVWAYVLILFHLGTWLLMEIDFPLHVLILALLFVMSPFQPQRWTFREVLIDLPGIAILRSAGLFLSRNMTDRRRPAHT